MGVYILFEIGSAEPLPHDKCNLIPAHNVRFGIDGTVDIRAPIKDVSQKVSPLPEEYMRVAELLREACIARVRGGGYSSFVEGGREGLPMEPGTLLPSPLGVE